MKSIIFASLIAFLLCTRLGAQSSPIGYYQTINKAELAICAKNLPAAASYYTKAFQINPNKPFTKDLLNAFYCAMDTKDYPIARMHIRRILSRGVNGESIWMIKSRFQGANLDSLNQWLALFRNDSLKSGYVAATIKKMHWRDQTTRMYFSRINDGNYMKEDSVQKMDEETGRQLAALFKKYGVPNEDSGSLSYYIAEGPMFDVLAMHYRGGYMSKRECHALDTFLFKAVFTYDYSAQNFAKFLYGAEMNVTKIPFTYGAYAFHVPITIDLIYVAEDSSIHPNYLAPDIEAVVNKERASIGLETLSELRQKVLFKTSLSASDVVYNKYVLGDGIGAYLDAEDHQQADPYIAKYEEYKPR
jgi:hypothetical protein